MRSRLSIIIAVCVVLASSPLMAATITWSLGPTYSGPNGFNALSTTGFLVDAGHVNWIGNGGTALGSVGTYKINSATLTIGSATDDYSQASTAHEVLVAYNPLTVTFNSFNGGGVAGVDFEALAEATGVISGPTTSFDLTDWVQSIADGQPDLGLYFPAGLASTNANFTENTNLVFTINAQAVVPEPASVAIWVLFGLALASGAAVARRRGAIS